MDAENKAPDHCYSILEDEGREDLVDFVAAQLRLPDDEESIRLAYELIESVLIENKYKAEERLSNDLAKLVITVGDGDSFKLSDRAEYFRKEARSIGDWRRTLKGKYTEDVVLKRAFKEKA